MQKSPPIDLIYKLCKMLEAEGVAYCHWKSNIALERSASGDSDLDLLVNRTDVSLFTDILFRLGFKEVRASLKQQLPGVLDYYGYDRGTGKLVHVHVHYQIILGDDMTKNYHLPIERAFLESTIQDGLFKIPIPELEFIVFVIRMVLKYATLDTISRRQELLPTRARRELEYLQTKVNQTRIYDILQQHLPYIDSVLFDRCVLLLWGDCPAWTRVKVAQQLQSRLQAHARRSQISDTSLKLWRRFIATARKRFLKRSSRQRMANGGAIIAIVGGDGSGKSTAVDEIYAWLTKHFDVIKVHMGKPSQSWSTFVVKSIVRINERFVAFPNRERPPRFTTDNTSSVFIRYLSLFRRVCIARDRYRAYVRARRFATNGGLVICDRYPIPQIKSMDGPQSAEVITTARPNRLIKFLNQLEKKYYQRIAFPELLIVLRVHPDIAVQRRTDEETGSVRARNQEIWELDWQQTYAQVIDANRSRSEVLSDIKFVLWSNL